MAKQRFTHFTPRDKPKKRPGKHKKSKSKSEKLNNNNQVKLLDIGILVNYKSFSLSFKADFLYFSECRTPLLVAIKTTSFEMLTAWSAIRQKNHYYHDSVQVI